MKLHTGLCENEGLQCFIFTVSDRSLSLAQITHLGSDLSLTIITPVIRPCGMWRQLAAKHEGQFQQEAPLYYFSLVMGGRMVVTTDPYKDCLQHAKGLMKRLRTFITLIR